MADYEQVQLPDGRRLDVNISGPPDGLPLVYHHGTPAAVPPIRALERAVHARGLRLVTTSRPGCGRSTRQPGRSVVDVVADTDALLAALGADRCVTMGWSGGGPHALACGARLGAVAAVLVVAGVAPYEADGLDWMAGMGELMRNIRAADIVASMQSLLPDVDQKSVTGEFAEDMAAGIREAMRSGIDGWLDDDLAFVKPWGFGLAEISVPTVVWQGSADLMVPFTHGQWLASRLPAASVHLEEGEGHLSVGLGKLDAMLDELVKAAGVTRGSAG